LILLRLSSRWYSPDALLLSWAMKSLWAKTPPVTARVVRVDEKKSQRDDVGGAISSQSREGERKRGV
jgi:hypothetical protein